MKTEEIIIKEVKIFKLKLKLRSMRGAIFCQVKSIKPFPHVSPSITPGNQKWRGAAPIFSSKDDLIKVLIKGFDVKSVFEVPKIKAANTTVNKRVAEAKAWIKKYFKEASVVIKLEELVIKGIKDRRLISRPTQAPNQEFAEILIIVPLKRVKMNKSLVGLLITRKKRRTNLYKRGMNPLASLAYPSS
jgi:hypothetical protein